ncbi:MAG: FAD-binding oxidoreductase [Acidimicrobiales bacterium]
MADPAIPNDGRSANDAAQRELLTGWGRTAPSTADVTHPLNTGELAAGLSDPPARGVLPRGLGRSYGDSAQNAGGRVLDTTAVSGVISFDPDAGTLTVLAGTSLDALMRWFVPRGFFVPVSPGTRYVTIGGAIANDIHGKNHHIKGSFSNHVRSLTLATPADGIVTVTPELDPELFWATAGGLGLTGVILDATFDLPRIETSRTIVDTTRTKDLDEVMALMESGDAAYEYSVAWIDLTATGARMGRSILDRGRFARLDELPPTLRRDPLSYDARQLVSAPPWVPPKLLNPVTIRAWNELWYRKSPKRRSGHLMTIPQYFHPLDMIRGWNAMYGPRGFLQWQIVVPFGAEETLRGIISELVSDGYGSGVTVLKRFGAGNNGPLSFPQPGWTLTVDFTTETPGLGPMLDRLDERVVEAGGRLYFAKDSRMRADLVPAMYPRIAEWRAVRERVDPKGVLRSDLARRLDLC